MTDLRPHFQNAHLDGDSFYLPGGPIGVLLLHGFTATTVEMRPLGEALHRCGWTISAPLLPGHGTSLTALARVHYRQYLQSVEQAYLRLRAVTEQVFVAGESMGGLLALHLGWKYPQIRGLLLYAPALRIRRVSYAHVLRYITPVRPKDYTTEPAIPDKFPWQGYTALPMAAVAHLHRLQLYTTRIMPEVQTPVIILQGLQDTTIVPSGAQEIYTRVGSKDKALHWLANSGHTIALGSEFDRLLELSYEFITTRQKSAA